VSKQGQAHPSRHGSHKEVEAVGIEAHELEEIKGFQVVILPNRAGDGFQGLFLDLAGKVDFYGEDIEAARLDAVGSLRVFLKYCKRECINPVRESPLDWSGLEVFPRIRLFMRSRLIKALGDRLQIVPAPPSEKLDALAFAIENHGLDAPIHHCEIIHKNDGRKSVASGHGGSMGDSQTARRIEVAHARELSKMRPLEDARMARSDGGKKGKAVQMENAKKRVSERTKSRINGDQLKLERLNQYRAKHPDCTLPEARDHLVRFPKLAFQSKKSAEDWLRDRMKRGEVQQFLLARHGRPPGAGKARRTR